MPIFSPLFRVGLLLTYRCNITCDHCLFSCGPDRMETMSQATSQKVIDQVCSLGAHWVSFTGGEPFLEPVLLLKLIHYASEMGLYSEAVTNCSWATTPEAATETLRLLSDAGLTAINMSVDDFHQKHIPLQYVKHCFQAAKTLDIKPVFMVVTRKGSVITAASLTKLMGDSNIQVMGEPRRPNTSALAMETPFTPVGRGKNIVHQASVKTCEGTLQCESILMDIGVTPDGFVLPCCGPLGSLDDAILGNIHCMPMEQILARARNNKKFIEIKNGFHQARDSTNLCHACYMHFGDYWKEGPSGPQWLSGCGTA